MAHGPGRVVVLHLPAELGAFAIAQNGKTLGAVLRGGMKILRLGHVHMGRVQGPHHGGFHITAVDAKAVFVSAEQGVEVLSVFASQRQVEPAHAVDQQVKPGTQVTRHDVHHADVATMRIEQHQLFNARRGDRLTDVRPQPDDGLILQRERAGKARVLGAQAHGLRGQKQHTQRIGQMRQGRRHHALHQHRVHTQRQVRAMLLGGRHGQHRNGLRRLARRLPPGKVLRGMVSPKT